MAGRAARLALFALCAAVLASARADSLLVFAPASLKESLDEVAARYEAASGQRVRVSYAASSALARQLDAGAPAHVFISADLQWMRYVEARGLVKGRGAPLLTNSLVLIAPARARPRLRIAPGFALASALGDGRLAIADPDSVPAGRYARAALQSLGVWAEVRPHLAPTESVRGALALVARAEAPLGIVYRTDARAEPRVAIVDEFAAATHPAIVYPVAVTRDAPAAAEALVRYLASPEARPVWQRHGFGFPS